MLLEATPSNLIYATDPIGVFYNDFAFPEVQFSFADPAGTRRLILSTTAPLTDAGETVSLIGGINGSNFSGECYNCDPYRFMTEGGLLSTTPLGIRLFRNPPRFPILLAGGLILTAPRRWLKH
jgi:hypothetical protein